MTRWPAIVLACVLSVPAMAAIEIIDHAVDFMTGQGTNFNLDITSINPGGNNLGQDGDIMIAFVAKDDDPLDTPGDGSWVEILRQGDAVSGDHAIGIWWREVTSWVDEPDNYTFSGDNEERTGTIVIIRNVDTADVEDATPVIVVLQNDTSPAVTGIFPDNDNALILYHWSTDGDKTVTSPGGKTVLMQQNGDGNGSASLAVSYEIQTTKGDTGTVEWTNVSGADPDSIVTAIAIKFDTGEPPAGRTRRMF